MDEKVKVSALPGAVNVNNNDLLYVVQNGVSKQLPFSIVKDMMSNGDVMIGTFDNSNLVGGIWTLNHAKETGNVLLFVFNADGFNQLIQWRKKPTDLLNSVEVDFGGSISQTYSYILIFWQEGTTTGGYDTNLPLGTDTNGNLITYTLAGFRDLISVYSKAEIDAMTQNPSITVGYTVENVGSGMNITNYTLRKYGNIVNFNARIEILYNTSGGYTRLCDFNVDIAPYPSIYGSVSAENSSLTESGSIVVNEEGKIYLNVGKSGQTWLCNVTWILIH